MAHRSHAASPWITKRGTRPWYCALPAWMRHGQRVRLDRRLESPQCPSTVMPTAATWHRARKMTAASRGVFGPLAVLRHVLGLHGVGCAPRLEFQAHGTARWAASYRRKNLCLSLRSSMFGTWKADHLTIPILQRSPLTSPWKTHIEDVSFYPTSPPPPRDAHMGTQFHNQHACTCIIPHPPQEISASSPQHGKSLKRAKNACIHHQYQATWPSGLRRHVKEISLISIFTDSVVRKGVSSNLTVVKLHFCIFASSLQLLQIPSSIFFLSCFLATMCLPGTSLCLMLCPIATRSSFSPEVLLGT
ncbi:hypothetical protein QBC39DRAFT_9183 [Podospora conica]|nr:hypothetical protein QBC39DRAFT_9183 [Schizothecium conicum]